MRSRSTFILSALATSALMLPSVAFAVGIPFFGPLIPDAQKVCPGNWSLVIEVVNRSISLALTIVIVFIAPITIAYAGFLYVINPMNSSGMSQAKELLKNAVGGIVLSLAAWLIVNAVMAVFYKASSPGFNNTPWSSIVTGDSSKFCLDQKGTKPGDGLNQASGTGTGSGTGSTTPPSTGGGGGGSAAGLCPDSNNACSPAALMAAGFSATEANVMSCIALTENSGRATGCNGNACGTFQIMLTVNPLVGPSCGGTLNCPSMCHGNNGAAVKTAECQPCVQAANTPACNAEAAHNLFTQSGYGPWTTSSDNTKSGACVREYGNG